MPRGEHFQNVPDERRCQATVTDKRSKNIGSRCPNTVMRGGTLCAAHAGVPQSSARVKQTLAPVPIVLPADIQTAIDVEREALARERQEEEERLQEHYMQLAQIRAEKRARALTPPKAPEGWIYARSFDVRDYQAGQALTDPETQKPFVWRLMTLVDYLQRERDLLVAAVMEPREQAVQEKLEADRQKAKRGWRPKDPLEALQAKRNGYREHQDDERYAAIEVDLSPEALGLR